MSVKIFSERFNFELNRNGFPGELSAKIDAVVKAFNVNGTLANNMLFGLSMPNPEILNTIACILDVNVDYLSGNTDRKKAYTPESSVS